MLAGGAGLWLYLTGRLLPQAASTEPVRIDEDKWLDHLQGQNPRLAEEAERHAVQLGPAALPEIQNVLRDPAADPARKKAALRACAVLGVVAAPAVAEVGSALNNPDLAAEAGLALSVMGTGAYAALDAARTSSDSVVRRESLRSLGKLRYRAPLDSNDVIPPLLDGLADPDPGVRAVAATYLGIIHDHAEAAVPALIETLKDENAEVRTAAAAALGGFGAAAEPALPALRKAAGDRDENVAREAGLSLVKLRKQ